MQRPLFLSALIALPLYNTEIQPQSWNEKEYHDEGLGYKYYRYFRKGHHIRPIRGPFLESTVNFSIQKPNKAIFVYPWEMVSASVRCLFYQPVDEKIKTWPLRLPDKENPKYREGIIRLASCVAVWRQSEVSIDFENVLRAWSFSPERSLNQPKATRVCIRSINQSNRSISIHLKCFCFVRAFSFQDHMKIALIESKATFTRYRTNSRPAEKFGRSLRLHGTVQWFSLCSNELWTARRLNSVRLRWFRVNGMIIRPMRCERGQNLIQSNSANLFC